MTTRETLPLPRPTALSRPHCDACRAGVLRVQRCGDRGACVFIPEPLCTACQSEALKWVESSGRGTLTSNTTVHRPPRSEFEVPYSVAIVELEEGWHMLTNLVECELSQIEVGLPVDATFRRMSEEISLPMFRPRR